MCVPQGASNSIKIQALSLPLAPTQSNDRFKKLPCSQKDVSISQNPRRESGMKLPACWTVGLETEEAGNLLPTQWLKLNMADARQGTEPRMGSSSLLMKDKKCFYQPLPRLQIHTY